MGSTNKYFKDKNGLGLNLWYEQKPYSGSTSSAQWTEDSKGIRNHSIDQNSKIPIYTTIFRRDENSKSEFVGSDLTNVGDADVNQTSLVDIINWSQKWISIFLTYADFAYLKNLGVYPTNRLMIARRFSGPTQNNLFKIQDSPMATMISWMPDDGDFFNITFGEEWESTQYTSFTDILTSVGEDVGIKNKKLGEVAARGGGVFSMPGWTEAIQNKIAGLLFGDDVIPNIAKNPPFGNPNLIKETMNRKLVSKDRPGSGLISNFSIKFVVEYEQKFLNGVDPSLVYLDILHKALIFGTSKSVFMFGDVVENGGSKFIQDLIGGDYDAVKASLNKFADSIGEALRDFAKELKAEEDSKTKKIKPDSEYVLEIGNLIVSSLVSKYRVKLFAVLQALTGAPSGYWHVTLGNPKKPFFSSGDLITTGVSMTFGKVLSFNDLPSSIKLEFTMIPTRNLGGQEIMDRFNTGSGRTYYQDKRSYIDIPDQYDNKSDRERFVNNLEKNNSQTSDQ